MTTDRRDNSRHIRARRGSEIKAKHWTTEAAVRMLMNNLDDEVAEDPQSLVVYGGIGRAARNWACYDKIVETLERLEEDQTLLIQSGKPVGVFRTHKDAPRVLLANSNLVPKWATWEKFNELDRMGLMMYGQMTAGSWIYIGSQGIVQGTYETFAEMGRQHFGGDLKGKWILTAGLGGMGGAQPLAAVMAGAHCIAIEVQDSRIEKRLETRYVDHRATSIDEALEIIAAATEPTSRRPARQRRRDPARNGPRAASAPTRSPTRPRRMIPPTAIARPAGASPSGPKCASAIRPRSPPPRASRWPPMSRRCSPSRKWASPPSTMATTSARKPSTRASPTPSTSPASSPPMSGPCSAAASARSAGLRCRAIPRTSAKTDAKVKELIPDDPHLHRWLDMAAERIAFQGLPARICWVGLGQRHRLGLAFNEMVRSGELSAPVVIGRDHLDSGSVASPNRETEAMQDGSDAVSDWPLLNALLNTAIGRDLGLAPPRRRGRHGLFAALRRGDRRRRHRRCRPPPRTRPLERPRHRRHAACGCGV